MPRSRRPVDTSRHLIDLRQLTAPLSWPELFGDDRPVELEVGPGKGLFLQMAAGARPGRNFVGVEMARKYARQAAERAAKHGLGNVRVVSGDARLFLDRLVPEGSLEAAHVYFPDPWWKKRHHKRRVFTGPFVDRVARVVRPGGTLFLATDVEGYYLEILGLLDPHPSYDRLPPAADEPGDDPMTNFERKYRLEGRPIFRASYRVTGPPREG